MNLEAVRARIARAALRAGRDPSSIAIVAVTKGHPVEVAREAVAAGLADLGENRVQEAEAKMSAWPDAPVRWHLIGHLQRNKARHAVGRFALIHSLDSPRLADALEREAASSGLVQDVLVQVNVAREPHKSGALPEQVEALLRDVARRPHLNLRGLMTMAPFTDDVAIQRAAFRGLRELRDAYRAGIGELSMGMSGDFEIAIEEGATMLRLGTVLFGERQV